MLNKGRNFFFCSSGFSGNKPKSTVFEFASCFFIFYLIASLIYYPSILINGRIWAEEAREFLIPLATTSRSFEPIFYLHKGHLDIFPNIATYLSLILPIQMTPYVFVWVALIPIACFSLCFGCYLYHFVFLRLCVEENKKTKLLQYFWISAAGFLASSSFIGIESHINTLNSWTFIVASVALLLPVTQTKKAPVLASVFVSMSPILAFPCVLFSPCIFLQLLSSKSSRIKTQNILFFISCTIQYVLPRMLPSDWAFGNSRCFQVRDIIAIIPTLFVKTIMPLIGNVHGFARQSSSIWHSYSVLVIFSITCLLLFSIVVYLYSNSINLHSIFSEYTSLVDTSLSRVIGSTSFLILSWQIFAIASPLNGAYAQLMLGGGYRYSYSIFLVCLAIMSIIFLSSTSSKTVPTHLLGKCESWQVRRFKVTQITSMQALSVGWLALMLIVSIHSQKSREIGDDFWCFVSRPKWSYHSHSEFIVDSLDPKSILTCPRGWDNTMQGQKKWTKDEKKIYCSKLY